MPRRSNHHKSQKKASTRSPMTGQVAQEIPTEEALTGAILTEVEKTVSQEDQWMPGGRFPWTGLHSHQDLVPWMEEVQCLQDLPLHFQTMITLDPTTP